MMNQSLWKPARWAAATMVVSAMIAAVPARAAWPPSGLPLATGPTNQSQPVGLTGPLGELHAFWVDLGPASFVLRSQHVTLAGAPAPGWPAEGRGIVTPPAAIAAPILTADVSGGAIVAWYDYRSSGGPRGIYAIRVDAEAAVLPGWNSSGTRVCTSTNAQGLGPLNDLVAACSDGAGGAFVAWTDARNTPPASTLIYDVFAQHVLSDGSLDPAWPAAGLGLTTGSGYKYPHGLIDDDAGGFWLVTEQSGATSRIAATHHDSDGTELGRWTSPSFASRATAISDGAGGIFMAWRDCRDCFGGSDAIYALRLGGNAVPGFGWPSDGLAIGNSPGGDDLPVIVATGDGAAMIAWLVPGSPLDAYVARRVEADGSFAASWQPGGQTFAISTDILSGWPLITPDGDSGAMFALRRNMPNLFGSRVTAAAEVPAAFPDTGLSLCTLSGGQFPEALVSDGRGGAFLMWDDRRDFGTSLSDVYLTRFTRDGEVGPTTGVEPPPPPTRGLAMSAPRPNPASSATTFTLTLPAASRARVEVIDLTGRRVAVLHDGDLEAGGHELHWDGRDRGRHRVPPGVYLLRASAGGASVVRRLVRMP